MGHKCSKCKHLPKGYRSKSGHLTLDPTTGATILEPHLPKAQ
jgi:hypothetical protein